MTMTAKEATRRKGTRLFHSLPTVRVWCALMSLIPNSLVWLGKQQSRKEGRQVPLSWYVCAAETRHHFSSNNAPNSPPPTTFSLLFWIRTVAATTLPWRNCEVTSWDLKKKIALQLVFPAAFGTTKSWHVITSKKLCSHNYNPRPSCYLCWIFILL